MFVKNDTSPEKLFYNGKIGRVAGVEDDRIYVLCPDEEWPIVVTPLKWDNVRYSLDEDTNEIREVTEGSFIQYPLKLAWAITIHKSQGLTFERAIIDAQASFAHGQVYVALSRCKTLEGMALSTPIGNRSIINDQTVSGFTQQIVQNQPDEAQLQSARTAYQKELLLDLFRFTVFRTRILYIEKIICDNRGSIPKPVQEVFLALLTPVRQDIIEVADRFHAQIHSLLPQQPDVEKNAALQERVGSAAGYFSEKMKSLLLDPIADLNMDIENKAVGKQFGDAVKRLEGDARLKYECLCAALSGFNLSALLKARAETLIEKEKPKGSRKVAPTDKNELANNELYERLRAWRAAKAQEMNLPAFGVFTQKTLYELVDHRPTDGKSLQKINGIGAKKFEQFGAEVMEIIRLYCEEQGI
jgi:hypothetical protein